MKLCRLNVLSRLLSLVFFITGTAVCSSLFALPLCILVLLYYGSVCGVSFKELNRRLKKFRFFLLLTVLPVWFSYGCVRALLIFVKLLCIAAASVVSFHDFDVAGLQYGTFVNNAVLVVSMTLNFAEVLYQEAQRIRDAQKARGMKENKNSVKRWLSFVPVVVPLFAGALRRAENLAVSMENRGFGAYGRRTLLYEKAFDKADILIPALFFLFCAGMVVLKVCAG